MLSKKLGKGGGGGVRVLEISSKQKAIIEIKNCQG